MRVVLLVTDLERGGTPLRLARLAVELKSAGVEPIVGCLTPPGTVSTQLTAAGVRTFACDARGRWDISVLLRLGVRLRQFSPDLIHSTLTHANVAARILGRWTGIPVLSSTATIEVERPLHLRLERLTARWDRGHIVGSAAVAEHVERAFRVPRERIHIIPPAVDPPRTIPRDEARRQLRLPSDAFVVAWAGRFDPVKRVEIAIDAVASEPNWYLALAGDGPTRPALERRAREVVPSSGGDEDRVRFLGWQDDLALLLSAADAFVLPSLTEGVPNALLQAMAAGLPCVVTDIPAFKIFVSEQPQPVISTTGNAGAFADALRSLAESGIHRAELGRAAANFARQLSWQRTTENLTTLYRAFALSR